MASSSPDAARHYTGLRLSAPTLQVEYLRRIAAKVYAATNRSEFAPGNWHLRCEGAPHSELFSHSCTRSALGATVLGAHSLEQEFQTTQTAAACKPLAPQIPLLACADYDVTMGNMYLNKSDPERVCDIGFGGISIASSDMKKGAKHSTSTLDGGQELIIYVPGQETDLWAFLKPFEPQVWMALFGTAVAIGVLIWLQEVEGDSSLLAGCSCAWFT